MSLNNDYLANESSFLVRVTPSVAEDLWEMVRFCKENLQEGWNYYPRFVPVPSLVNNTIEPAYFWFADNKDMTLFRLRFDSYSADQKDTWWF